MKNFILRMVDYSLGKIIRVVQNMMIVREYPRQSVLGHVEKRFLEQSAEFIGEFMDDAMLFYNRKTLWDYIINLIPNAGQVVLEFGVYKGESINYFASKMNQSRIYGFDSFRGLSEDWTGHTMPKGTFDLAGSLPQVAKNVTLVPGWFEDSLDRFLNENDLKKISLLHLDVDTYTPTHYVLNKLSNLIQPGTFIIFDEYFGYHNWKRHEHRAWLEFAGTHRVSYKYIAFSEMQVAIEII